MNHGALNCRGHWKGLTLWPDARWWHVGDDAIAYCKHTSVKPEQNEVLQASEACGNHGVLERLGIRRDVACLRVDANDLASKERDHNDNQCHEERGICAKV